MSQQWDKEVDELQKAYDEESEAQHRRLVRATSEALSRSGALAVGGGCAAVPVCELEKLAESWLHRFYSTLEAKDNLLYCRDELRRLIARATERQPQHNKGDQP